MTYHPAYLDDLPGHVTAFVPLASAEQIVHGPAKVLEEDVPVASRHLRALVPPGAGAAHPAWRSHLAVNPVSGPLPLPGLRTVRPAPDRTCYK